MLTVQSWIENIASGNGQQWLVFVPTSALHWDAHGAIEILHWTVWHWGDRQRHISASPIAHIWDTAADAGTVSYRRAQPATAYSVVMMAPVHVALWHEHKWGRRHHPGTPNHPVVHGGCQIFHVVEWIWPRVWAMLTEICVCHWMHHHPVQRIWPVNSVVWRTNALNQYLITNGIIISLTQFFSFTH